MIFLILFIEFLIIGSFSVGGGLATLPFLYNLADRYTWFDRVTLIDMIAISESTPGPIGINMATYAGFKAAGFFGGLVASIALMITGIVFMIIIAKMMDKFKEHIIIKKIFYGLRPTVAALISYAAYQMISVTLFEGDIKLTLVAIQLSMFTIFYYLLQKNKISPIQVIMVSAVLGLILPFNG